jgi:lipopolysaccharide/colanic/teichoic acid biosynthesis glycosyltransferase
MSSRILDNSPAVDLARYEPAKRAFDVLLGASAVLITWPVAILIALVIKLDSPGPVIFTQPRLGRRKRIFNVYKFRTMQIDGSPEPAKPSSPLDERLTRVGRWLRRSSLDELPQLVNVLRGEMSIVGPRPERSDLLARYPPGMDSRFDVLPGLTGWWQVNGRQQPMYDHLDYDVYYVQHRSFAFDLRIVLMTVRAVLSGKGAV